MKIITFSLKTLPITLFNSSNTSSIQLGSGKGESRVHFLNFEKNSEIGEHIAGFDQLFIVVTGQGWVAGSDGKKVEIKLGQAAIFEKGQKHSKGSQEGMQVIMVQIERLCMIAQ